MNRYQSMFETLQRRKQGAFVPFVMLADPNPVDCLEVIDALVEGGADALELGIPFSDPIADGPTIQQASIRALAHKTTPLDCLELVKKIRQKYPSLPIGLLLYSNLVMAQGLNGFYQRCAECGVDSVLVADVPIREAEPFRAAANQHGIDHIVIAPPNASDETIKDIGKLSQGYTYLLGRAGVTGTETEAAMPTNNMLEKLRDLGAAPAIMGFGISTPEHVTQVVGGGAAGAIAGSATVKLIEQNQADLATLKTTLLNFTKAMKQATSY